VRLLILVLLLATSLLAPLAWAQTAGPSIPTAAPHGKIKSAAPKAKIAPRVVNHRTTRPAARKVVAAKRVTKAKAPVHRAPGKQAEVTGQVSV
jgi:hypothetical protein